MYYGWTTILREVKLMYPKVSSVTCILRFLTHTLKQYVHEKMGHVFLLTKYKTVILWSKNEKKNNIDQK